MGHGFGVPQTGWEAPAGTEDALHACRMCGRELRWSGDRFARKEALLCKQCRELLILEIKHGRDGLETVPLWTTLAGVVVVIGGSFAAGYLNQTAGVVLVLAALVVLVGTLVLRVVQAFKDGDSVWGIVGVSSVLLHFLIPVFLMWAIVGSKRRHRMKLVLLALILCIFSAFLGGVFGGLYSGLNQGAPMPSGGRGAPDVTP